MVVKSYILIKLDCYYFNYWNKLNISFIEIKMIIDIILKKVTHMLISK